MQNILIPTLIRSIHNIFTSIWIGGMATILFSFTPAIKQSIDDKLLQKKIMQTMINYQSRWVYFGIALLTITGILMSRLSGSVKRPFDFSNFYASILSIKHILVIIVSFVAILRSLLMKRPISNVNSMQNKLGNYLLLINTVLGFLIIILSSINATII